jgi:hypothetical protein
VQRERLQVPDPGPKGSLDFFMVVEAVRGCVEMGRWSRVVVVSRLAGVAGGRGKKKGTGTSNVVTHRSTNPARWCLASLSRREVAFSP